jgi:hypothetical protein
VRSGMIQREQEEIGNFGLEVGCVCADVGQRQRIWERWALVIDVTRMTSLTDWLFEVP